MTYHTHKHIIALYVVYDCMSHDQEIEKVNVTNYCEPDLEGSTGSYLMDAIPSV